MATDPPSLRLQIDRHIADGDVQQGLGLLKELWRLDSTPAQAGFVNSRIARLGRKAGLQPFRARILRSFTVEPVIPLLKAAGCAAGLDIQVSLGDFNAYVQEILSPGGEVYASDPDLVILAVQTRDVAPGLWNGFSALSAEEAERQAGQVVEDFKGWIRALRARSRSSILVHSLELPPRPAQGVLDQQLAHSQVRTIRQINDGLAEFARSVPGTYVLDWDGLIAAHGRLGWTDERKWLAVRLPIQSSRLLDVAEEWMRFIHPLSGKVAKCLVCDLDNTLWGGVVGEEGPEGVRIGPDYPGAGFLALQDAVLDLHHRGIILAVCSKNNREDAMAVLANHPAMRLRPEHFSAVRLNWEDKAANLRSIAEELNIGLDSLVFMDDNPVECQNVRRQLPVVRTLHLDGDPMSFADRLRRLPVFERLAMSEEDRNRGRLYAAKKQRDAMEAESGSLEDFYRSLEMRATLARLETATLARAAQLTQKTNQFNMTTRRYSESQLDEFASRQGNQVWTIRVEDRFGDNGIVGLVMIEETAEGWSLENFLLSCRVIGRTIETAILATLCEAARERGVPRLAGAFLPTAKNAPAAGVYERHGFTRNSEEGSLEWRLDLASRTIECPPWIHRSLEGIRDCKPA